RDTGGVTVRRHGSASRPGPADGSGAPDRPGGPRARSRAGEARRVAGDSGTAELVADRDRPDAYALLIDRAPPAPPGPHRHSRPAHRRLPAVARGPPRTLAPGVRRPAPPRPRHRPRLAAGPPAARGPPRRRRPHPGPLHGGHPAAFHPAGRRAGRLPGPTRAPR